MVMSWIKIPCLVILATCGLVAMAPVYAADYLQPVQNVVSSDYGYFHVSSEPPGADVVFDDRYVGETPVTVPIFSSGSPGHTIRISKIGYVHHGPSPIPRTLYPGRLSRSLHRWTRQVPPARSGYLQVLQAPW